jgi:hypothetical protein
MRRISLKNCPYCGCSKIYASRSATPWDRFYALFWLRLVRCHVCMRRHYRPMFVRTPDNPARKTAPGKAAEVFSFERRGRKRPFDAA